MTSLTPIIKELQRHSISPTVTSRCCFLNFLIAREKYWVEASVSVRPWISSNFLFGGPNGAPEDGAIEVTLKESSILARGLPFHLRLQLSDTAGTEQTKQMKTVSWCMKADPLITLLPREMGEVETDVSLETKYQESRCREGFSTSTREDGNSWHLPLMLMCMNEFGDIQSHPIDHSLYRLV